MHLKLIFCALFLAGCTLGYDARKSSDKDKALAYKEKLEKSKKSELSALNGEDEEEIRDLKDIEKDAGYEDEEDDEAEDDEAERAVPKKKVPKKQQKPKRIPTKKKKLEKPKKNKENDPEIKFVIDTSLIPNMTSFDFVEMAREHRINKLREIINNTPPVNIEKMRQITDELKDEVDDDDDNVYEACNAGTSPDDELCHCDMDEINCSSIIMESDDPRLHTMNLAIMKKDFKPVIANFSDNLITRLQSKKVIPQFEKYVSKLDISYNRLRFIDNDVFKPFTNLSHLDLSHNDLLTIKKPVFEAAKDTLRRLDIGYNTIKVLDNKVFDGLKNLKVLILDGNPIKVWKKEIFEGLDNLEELSLDYCSIETLPSDIFENLPKLISLSIRGNKFEEIPAVVANMKTLKNVDMSETTLTEIRDHAFAGDSDLEEIILEKMPYLSVIRDCGFCGLPKLKILLLNNNAKMQEIHPNAFGFVKSEPGHKAAAITEFDINSSHLSNISEHMLDYDKLSSFKIGGNPWLCNCETEFLLDEQFSFKQDSVAPKCRYPEVLKDRHLETVKATEACESARFLGRSGRFSSVLGLALLVGFIAIGSYYMVSSGKLEKLVRQVRKEPEVSYTNLQTAGEDFALESDFQPRPAEV